MGTLIHAGTSSYKGSKTHIFLHHGILQTYGVVNSARNANARNTIFIEANVEIITWC